MAKEMTHRGMDVRKEAQFAVMYGKEKLNRTKWFHRNRDKLTALAEQKHDPRVTPEMLEDLQKSLEDTYRNVEKHNRVRHDDAPMRDLGDTSVPDIMKPVDPETAKIIYTSCNRDGRVRYLKERSKILPEDRYYFPETMGFKYGWNMSHLAKEMGTPKTGRCSIIKNSFYRRNQAGIVRDPDHYREPEKLSPSVCDCN